MDKSYIPTNVKVQKSIWQWLSRLALVVFYITISPKVQGSCPAVSASSLAETICSGTSSPITLSSAPAGATFTWTTFESGVVGAFAGSGFTINQLLTTSGFVSGFVIYTVTPHSGVCAYPPIIITITVNPVPIAVAVPDSERICAKDFTSIFLNSAVAGTSFSWVVTQSSTIGASDGSGPNGTLIAQQLDTVAATAGIATYNITPLADGCTGYTIYIPVHVDYLIPTVSAAPPTQTVCSGSPISTITITNPNHVAGTTFSWTRDNNFNLTSIAPSGAGATINGIFTNNTNVVQTTTFTIIATAGGCSSVSTTVSVTVNPQPTITATPVIQTVCSGVPITLIAISNPNLVAGTTFSWIRNNIVNLTGMPNFGGGTPISGTLTNNTNTPQMTVFSITATATGCGSTAFKDTVIVDPTPTVSAAPVAQTVCSGTPITTINITNPNFVAGTTFSWTRDNNVNLTGIAAIGSGTSISGTLINITNTPQVTTFTIIASANGCPSLPTTITVTVNPIPTLTATPSSQTVCAGLPITTINIFNPNGVVGTTFTWTRDNTVNLTGIPGAGGGNSISGTFFTIINIPQTTYFTITAHANGCPSTTFKDTVVVNPTPTVSASPISQTVCSGTPISTINITNTNGIAGTTFTWTRDNNVNLTGIPGAGGGNSISGTFTNNTNFTQVAAFTITATANGCSSSTIVTVSVKPMPTLSVTPTSQTVCSGLPITTITITNLNGIVGTSFTWTRDNNVNLTGIAASGSGASISGTLTNVVNSPQTTYFTITASANSCTSATLTDTVVVSPAPTVSASPVSQTVCSGIPITAITITNPNGIAGTTFNWTRDNNINLTGIVAGGAGPGISGTLTNITNTPQVTIFSITASANGCTTLPILVTATVNPTPAVTATPLIQTVCSGLPIAPITITNSNGVGGTTFSWTRDNIVNLTGIAANGNGAGISGTLTNTTNTQQATIFTITATANGCPSITFADTVKVNPSPTLGATPVSQTVCSGVPITSITITNTNGIAGTTFSWIRDNTVNLTGIAANGNGASIAGALTNTTAVQQATIFTITATATGCPSATFADTVKVNPPPTMTSINSATICSGGTVNIPLTSNFASTFTWIATDNVNTTGESITIQSGSPLNNTISNNSASDQIVTYTVTPTSSPDGCVGNPQTASVTVHPAPTMTNTNTAVICSGGTINIPLTSNIAATYTWIAADNLNTTGESTTLQVSGTLNNTIINNSVSDQTVIYTVTPTSIANGCAGIPQVVTVTVHPNPTMTSASSATICSGGTVNIPLTSSVGSTFTWIATDNLNTTGESTTLQAGSSLNNTITNNTALVQTVSYTVTPTSILGSCGGISQIVTVTVLVPLNAGIVNTPANCGVCNGTMTITPLNGTSPYTYLWNAPNIPGAGQNTANGTLMCAALYSITVTDFLGCQGTFTSPLNSSSGPSGVTSSTVAATCNGLCNGKGNVISVIGGVPPYTYLWNDGPGTTTNNAINLCAGNYMVQVKDSNSCVHFNPITINQPMPIAAHEVITSAQCSGVCNGAITVAPTGGTPGTSGYAYAWTPGNPVGQATNAVSALCPGTYSLTITDSNSCVNTFPFVVGQTAPLTATINSISLCSASCNGMAYVTITSGAPPYTFHWNDPMNQTHDTATALCAGNYSVIITDAGGCTITLTATISVTTGVSANAVISNAACGLCNGQATLNITSGTAPFTYLWSNSQTSNTASGLCAGLYTANITDSIGCVTHFSIPISNITGPASTIKTFTNITCSGTCNGAVTSLAPVGGTPPYTFLWLQGGHPLTDTISNLCAGVYFVQIADANGCTLVDSVTITTASPIVANQTVTPATCGVCDGSISIVPSGGSGNYSYSWNTTPVLTTSTITSQCANVYSVQIKDITSGCVQQVVIPLNSQSGPTLITSTTPVSCNGLCNGKAWVVASSGTVPYTYLWTDGPPTTANDTAVALCRGTYFVKVTDGANCVSISSVLITQPPPLAFGLANIKDPLCSGNNIDSITVTPSGGTLPYSFSWSSGGSTNGTAANLPAGAYTVTVTDANGCIATQTNTLVIPPPLTISNVSTNPSCNTTADGAISITVGGGKPGYSYQWSGGSTLTTQNLNSILIGSYSVTVTDTNGCTIKDTVVLTSALSVIAHASNDTTFCGSGSLTLSGAGSSASAVNYHWFQLPANTAIGSTIDVSVTPPTGITNYYLLVDNGLGCSDRDTVKVIDNPSPAANAGPDVFSTGTGVTIGGNPTGSGGSSFQWNPTTGLDNGSSTNPIANPATTTTYTVTVTTAQGCTGSDAVIVKVETNIVFANGISPNGDGANDEWIIDNIELFPNCLVEIYNRWGELLFQSIGYKEKWNGMYKGKVLPVGTYYYIIDLKDPLFPNAYTGPITILR